ncbi:MAG: hypothetical protein WED07_04460 [Candidatus Freyarchaeum deiterrae]
MKNRDRLSKLRNEIDELLSEVEKTPELTALLERMELLESKFDKINEIENSIKNKPGIESLVITENVLEKIGDIDSKIVAIREDVSSLKNQFEGEVKSLRMQMGNVVEAILDLVKTIAPEIIKPETRIPLEPLEKIAREKPLAAEATHPKVASETAETIKIEVPKEEQIIIKTPTILTQLDLIKLPVKIEETPITGKPTEISAEESTSEKEISKEPESELDRFVSAEDEKILKELGLDMIDRMEKKIKLPEKERLPSYIRLTNLKMKKLKLIGEINDLKTAIQVGFASPEEEKTMEDKIREKDEVEKQIQELENKM